VERLGRFNIANVNLCSFCKDRIAKDVSDRDGRIGFV
jgi:hypothetical protein